MTFSNSFVPNGQIIANITNANPGVVTTSIPHGYKNGLYVRLIIPDGFGMIQVNNQMYLITIIDATTFSIDANTTNFDPFIDVMNRVQNPQVIPTGEIALTLINAVVNNDNIIPEL
jgi:hypothetical protein